MDAIDQVPTVAPIESVVKTAVPLSYAATVAMASVNGATYSHVMTSNTCTGYPCASTMIIIVEPDTLPVQLDGVIDNGEIFIAGLWSSANQAILTVLFNGVSAGNEFLPIRKISTIPVTQLNDTVTVVYSSLDIDIDSESSVSIDLNDAEILDEYDRLNQAVDSDPEVNVGLDAWVVEVETGGTSTDFSDDEYRVVGGGQYFEAGPDNLSALQIGVVELLVTADCALNPTDGNAVLQEARVSPGDRSFWPIVGQAIIEFQPACDGTARVLLGTGSFLLASGDDIDLGFSD